MRTTRAHIHLCRRGAFAAGAFVLGRDCPFAKPKHVRGFRDQLMPYFIQTRPRH